jgi:hypothetical protein
MGWSEEQLRGQSVAEVGPSYRLHFRGDWKCKLFINGTVRYRMSVQTNTRGTYCCLIVVYVTSWLRKLLHLSETRCSDMFSVVILVYKFTECSRHVVEVPTSNLGLPSILISVSVS